VSNILSEISWIQTDIKEKFQNLDGDKRFSNVCPFLHALNLPIFCTDVQSIMSARGPHATLGISTIAVGSTTPRGVSFIMKKEGTQHFESEFQLQQMKQQCKAHDPRPLLRQATGYLRPFCSRTRRVTKMHGLAIMQHSFEMSL